jgi:hypothetical protein
MTLLFKKLNFKTITREASGAITDEGKRRANQKDK